jgi:NitT/TauT family transport system substrate-binding protein
VVNLPRKLGALAASTLAVGLLAAGCGGSGGSAQAPAKSSSAPAAKASPTATKLRTFAIGYPAVDANFLVEWVGIDQGFFKKNGLDVKMNVLSGSGSETGALLSGSLQMVLSDSTAPLEAIAKGAPIVFVGSEENVYPSQVVGKPSITSLAGLEGHVLGLEHVHSLMWSAAIQALQMNHVPLSKVQLDYLGAPPTLTAGLLSGKVDAMVNDAPFVNEAEAKGFHMIYSMTNIPHVSGGFLVTKAFLAQHPDEITDFLKGFIEASAFAHNPANAAVVKQDIAQAMHLSNPALVNDMYDYFLPLLQIDPTIPSGTMDYTLNYVKQVTGKTVTESQAVDLSLVRQLEQSGFVKQAQAQAKASG